MCSINQMTIDTSALSIKQVQGLLAYIDSLKNKDPKTPDISPDDEADHDALIRAVLDAPERPYLSDDDDEDDPIADPLFETHHELVQKLRSDFAREVRHVAQTIRFLKSDDQWQQVVYRLAELRGSVEYKDLRQHPIILDQCILVILKAL